MYTAISNESAAVVIVSNGPGELATWVKPVLDYLIKEKSKSINLNVPNYKLILCGRRDLNSQGLGHTLLRRARLPIPPHPLIWLKSF